MAADPEETPPEEEAPESTGAVEVTLHLEDIGLRNREGVKFSLGLRDAHKAHLVPDATIDSALIFDDTTNAAGIAVLRVNPSGSYSRGTGVYVMKIGTFIEEEVEVPPAAITARELIEAGLGPPASAPPGQLGWIPRETQPLVSVPWLGWLDTADPGRPVLKVNNGSAYIEIGGTGGGGGGPTWRLTTAQPNINVDIAGAVANDILVWLGQNTTQFYRRLNTDAEPYWELVGSIAAGGHTTGEINALIANWWAGNPSVDAAQLPYTVEPWAKGVGDIPYSALDSVLESWAVKDSTPPLEMIPIDRLPVARLLPVPDPDDDPLKIPQVNASGVGYSLIALPSGGDGNAAIWRVEYVEGDPLFGQGGKVFIRLRYIDTFNDAGVLQSTVDAGNGYLGADGHRHISQGNALDIKALLASASVDALMDLVAEAPAAADATSGLWYGVGDGTDVDEVRFRKRVAENTRVLLRIGRCSGRTDGTADGYNSVDDINLDMGVGGSLSPGSDDILSAVDVFQSSSGRYYHEVIVPQASHINGATGVWLSYGTDPDNLTQIFLARDATYAVDNRRRYASAVDERDRTWAWGHTTWVEFRNSQNGNPVALTVTEVMESVADRDWVSGEVHAVGVELGNLEDRVAALEARGVHVKDEDNTVDAGAQTLDFRGTGVTASDVPGDNNDVIVTIPGPEGVQIALRTNYVVSTRQWQRLLSGNPLTDVGIPATGFVYVTILAEQRVGFGRFPVSELRGLNSSVHGNPRGAGDPPPNSWAIEVANRRVYVARQNDNVFLLSAQNDDLNTFDYLQIVHRDH